MSWWWPQQPTSDNFNDTISAQDVYRQVADNVHITQPYHRDLQIKLHAQDGNVRAQGRLRHVSAHST